MKKSIEQVMEENEKSFDEQFTPDWWKGFGTTDDIDKKGIEGIKSHLHQFQLNLIKAVVGEAVGEIGAKLLAKHSSQAILDAYFDSANEVLEQHEINN